MASSRNVMKLVEYVGTEMLRYGEKGVRAIRPEVAAKEDPITECKGVQRWVGRL